MELGDFGGHGAAVGLTVAVVTVLRKRLTLTAPALVFTALIVAAVLCVVVDLALHAGTGEPLHWQKIPLNVVVSWLSAMGMWSGGKVILEQVIKSREDA